MPLAVTVFISVTVRFPFAGQTVSAQGLRKAICAILGGDHSGTAQVETEENCQAQLTVETDSSASASTADIAFIPPGGNNAHQRATLNDGFVHVSHREA